MVLISLLTEAKYMYMYGGTPLMWTPLGPGEVTCISGVN